MKDRKLQLGERPFLWFSFVVAVVFLIAAIRLYIAKPGVGGPSAFPLLAASIMVIGAGFSLLEIIKSSTEQIESDSLETKALFVFKVLFPDKVLIIMIYCFVYAFLMSRIGFYFSTFLFLFCSMVTLSPRKPLQLAFISICLLISVWIVFVVVFRVRLP